MEINFWLLFKKLIKYQNVYMCRKSVEETFGVFEMGRKYTNSKRYVYKSFVYRLTKVLTVCQTWKITDIMLLHSLMERLRICSSVKTCTTF